MSRIDGLTVSKLAMAMAMAGVIALPAQAVDFDGYFRAGPGATSKGAARACYKLSDTDFSAAPPRKDVSGAGTF
ncbi:MAG TPA: hypothetical protein VGJ65_09605, partial [Albitalea sp.]